MNGYLGKIYKNHKINAWIAFLTSHSTHAPLSWSTPIMDGKEDFLWLTMAKFSYYCQDL